MSDRNPFEAAAEVIVSWYGERGHNAIPAYVALTSAILRDGTEVAIPLGPARASWIEAAEDGIGKGGVVALVMRDGGPRDDSDGKPSRSHEPNPPDGEEKPSSIRECNVALVS